MFNTSTKAKKYEFSNKFLAWMIFHIRSTKFNTIYTIKCNYVWKNISFRAPLSLISIMTVNRAMVTHLHLSTYNKFVWIVHNHFFHYIPVANTSINKLRQFRDITMLETCKFHSKTQIVLSRFLSQESTMCILFNNKENSLLTDRQIWIRRKRKYRIYLEA